MLKLTFAGCFSRAHSGHVLPYSQDLKSSLYLLAGIDSNYEISFSILELELAHQFVFL